MRRRFPAVLGLLALLVLSVAAYVQPAGAATSVDRLAAQRRAVQQKRAAQAAQLNVLKATDQQVGQALDALAANRRSTEALVASARQRSDAERARAAAARAAEASTTAKLGSLRDAVRDAALAEYMRGHKATDDLSPDPESPMETVRRRSLLQAAVGDSADASDQLKSAQEDIRLERSTAEVAATAAAAQQRKVEQHLAELKAATQEQQAVAGQVEGRIEQALAEADSLAALDGNLATQLNREQDAIAARLRATPSIRADGPAVVGGGGTITRSEAGPLTTVRGITVASSIADNLASMLAAADADGISLGGHGYRDSSQQVATRRSNCGSSSYDIYEKPASSCSPPTARPGSSMHERGLAIDFTSDGTVLTRSSAGYRWLQGNASRFGFYNLPSEAWHWSVNGN